MIIWTLFEAWENSIPNNFRSLTKDINKLLGHVFYSFVKPKYWPSFILPILSAILLVPQKSVVTPSVVLIDAWF